MRLLLPLLALLLLPPAATACDPMDLEGTGGADSEPRLLVYIVVDQLRGDMLDRYADLFEGGFARFHDEGRRWVSATFDHQQTSTAPGHATAATGLYPHRHGLVGNNWNERTADGGWGEVYSLRDLDSEILGQPEMEGRGPANLLAGGLPDWIQEAYPEARVVSLSGKDRAAIAMAGRSRGEVYWFDSSLGRFLTSTAYRTEYPEWVESFHTDPDGLPALWGDTVWSSTVPAEARGLSRPDTFAYEGDGVNTYFPHRFSREVAPEGWDGRVESLTSEGIEALNEWRARAPWVDEVTLALATRAVRELQLGARAAPDYLALPLSQVDRVGHDYGPLSREQMDNLLRLDRNLGDFFDFLDREVGEGRWVAALTADHGVIEIPEGRAELGLYGRRIARAERRELVARAEAAALATDADELEQARAAAAAAMEFEWVEDAFPWADVAAELGHDHADRAASQAAADSFRILYARSYHPNRVLGHLGHLGVAYRMGEGVYDGRATHGTGHGSPYYYDRHVPFMVLGPGVEAGVREEPVSVVDLAPTLATLLRIPVPEDLDGVPRPLEGGALSR